MAIKSALFSLATAVVLILVLGNQTVVDRLQDGNFRDTAFVTRRSIPSQLRWDLNNLPDDIRLATVLRLLTFIAVAAVLGGLAGRARPAAALVGGWGAGMAAATVSAVVYTLTVDDRFVRGDPRLGVIDSISFAVADGAIPGFWLGWLFALAVLLGSFGRKRPKVVASDTRVGPPGRTWSPPAGQGYPPTSAAAAAAGAPARPTAPELPTPPTRPSGEGPVVGPPPERTRPLDDA